MIPRAKIIYIGDVSNHRFIPSEQSDDGMNLSLIYT